MNSFFVNEILFAHIVEIPLPIHFEDKLGS